MEKKKIVEGYVKNTNKYLKMCKDFIVDNPKLANTSEIKSIEKEMDSIDKTKKRLKALVKCRD